MDHFNYRDGVLYAEDVPLSQIANDVGTPCYVYSRATLERHWHAFNDALGNHPHLICYSVKANSNLAVLNLFARMGSGFDVVSIGELERVIAAGGDVKKTVFSGIGKTEDELKQALAHGIYCFNVESLGELELLNQIAIEMQTIAQVSLRVNPDVDAKTHPYIATGLKQNKFGIAIELAAQLYRQHDNYPGLSFIGIDCHIGSQLTELDPFLDALDRILAMMDELKQDGIVIEHIDLGGGLGVTYHTEKPPQPIDYAAAVKQKLRERTVKIILEPGRAIAANAGVLVTKVLYLKDNVAKHFAIVDAAMNDLLRPALYQAWQTVIPLQENQDGISGHYDIVGPVCETGDFLAKDRELTLKPGALLAVRTAGAYGFVMSSNYNSRPRVPEVMVDGDQYHIVRQRESIAALFALESMLPDGAEL